MTTSSETEPVTACPCCGSITGTTLAQAPALLAVCDVLVVRALEAVGKHIVRADRHRYPAMRGRPWHTAHTLWRPEPQRVDKGLQGAWDVVPAMLSAHGCCGVTARQITTMLDDYARDLLITGTQHDLSELRYRFESRLGIIVPAPEPYTPGGIPEQVHHGVGR